MPGWQDRLRGRFRGSKATPETVFSGLRSMALSIELSDLDLPPGEPWSGALVAMMEIGLKNGIASFVAIADGSVSMYTSTGGGVIGAGEHAAVRAAADRFRRVAADVRDQLVSTMDFPLPTPGEVRFQVRTSDGGYTAAAAEAALRSGRHPLTELYASGQDLITEIRLASPP